VLEVILRELFGDAVKTDKKSRLRSLKDLDEAAATLASACQMLLNDTVPDAELRKQLFSRISPDALALALSGVNKLIRPTDNVYYQELDAKYKTVRRFLPALAKHIHFGANAAGEPFIAAFAWLRTNMMVKRPATTPVYRDRSFRSIVTTPFRSIVTDLGRYRNQRSRYRNGAVQHRNDVTHIATDQVRCQLLSGDSVPVSTDGRLLDQPSRRDSKIIAHADSNSAAAANARIEIT